MSRAGCSENWCQTNRERRRQAAALPVGEDLAPKTVRYRILHAAATEPGVDGLARVAASTLFVEVEGLDAARIWDVICLLTREQRGPGVDRAQDSGDEFH